MKIGDAKFQEQAQEVAETFRVVFKKLEEDIPQRVVLSGMAAAMAERGIMLAPEGMPLEEAAQRTIEMVEIYCAQAVAVLEEVRSE